MPTHVSEAPTHVLASWEYIVVYTLRLCGFRVGQCLYVTLMQVLEFLVNTSYFLTFTIHIVLNPSVMAVGALAFLRHLYALPMHVWENLYWSYNCVMFALQWVAATSCAAELYTLRPCMFQSPTVIIRYAHACFRVDQSLYVTPMHVFVFASAHPTLEPCQSLNINTFGQNQAECGDANLFRRYMTLWELHFS